MDTAKAIETDTRQDYPGLIDLTPDERVNSFVWDGSVLRPILAQAHTFLSVKLDEPYYRYIFYFRGNEIGKLYRITGQWYYGLLRVRQGRGGFDLRLLLDDWAGTDLLPTILEYVATDNDELRYFRAFLDEVGQRRALLGEFNAREFPAEDDSVVITEKMIEGAGRPYRHLTKSGGVLEL